MRTQRPKSKAVWVICASLLFVWSAWRLPAAVLGVNVRPVFAGEPLLLDSLRYQTTAGETFSFTRLSGLLSGFALQRADGTWLELPDDYAWIDAEKRRTLFHLPGITPGTYRSIRFYVGPDAAANKAKPSRLAPDHPLHPNLNGLHWSWQGGYIFLAVEGLYRGNNQEVKGYSFHLARDPHRTPIVLSVELDLTEDALLDLDLDLGALFHAPRPISLTKDGTSTHSREGDPIAEMLGANLPGAFRIRRSAAVSSQVAKLPRVEPLFLPATYTPYPFKMSGTFPIPDLPLDNPLIQERVALGEALFNEGALSRDGKLACASCHASANAFSDGRRFSRGVDNRSGSRNAMPLFNLAWKKQFFWDGRAPSLRTQALIPIQDHAEMDEKLERVIAKLTDLSHYRKMFEAAFGSPEITPAKIGLALEQYLLILTSYDSKFDRAMNGQETLTREEQRGFELFMTEHEPRTGQFGADCFHCHGGPLFSDLQFHNNGLAATNSDRGRFAVTRAEGDYNEFSTPSLRNVELTGPYMHDGRFKTLVEVVEHYSSGVQNSSTLDPNLAKHPSGGLNLSVEDKRALVAFLRTLTDEKYRRIDSKVARGR